METGAEPAHLPRENVLWLDRPSNPGAYVLCRGVLETSHFAADGHERWLDVLAPGELVGVEHLFPETIVATVARALDDATLVWVAKDSLLDLMAHSPVAESVLRQLAQRIQRLDRRNELARSGSARSRLIWELLQLARRLGRRRGGGVELLLRLHKADLESLANLGHTATTEARRGLEDEGLLRFERGRIALIDPFRLADELDDPREREYWRFEPAAS